MVTRESLTQDQITAVLRDREFGSDIVTAAPRVAVVMTQGWCPQWHHLNAGLTHLVSAGDPGRPDLSIFTFIYDESEYFDEFLFLKERFFGNAQIPYIRYYHEGRLIDQSNFVTVTGFLSRWP